MYRLHIMLVKPPRASGAFEVCAENILNYEMRGHLVSTQYDAMRAIRQIKERSHPRINAVVIDEFSLEDAELIACEIKTEYPEMYICIMSKTVKSWELNDYATDVIPVRFQALKEILETRFVDAA